ncbi:C40 family peptidase, partial [Streptomyces sp. MUM 136J]
PAERPGRGRAAALTGEAAAALPAASPGPGPEQSQSLPAVAAPPVLPEGRTGRPGTGAAEQRQRRSPEEAKERTQTGLAAARALLSRQVAQAQAPFGDTGFTRLGGFDTAPATPAPLPTSDLDTARHAPSTLPPAVSPLPPGTGVSLLPETAVALPPAVSPLPPGTGMPLPPEVPSAAPLPQVTTAEATPDGKAAPAVVFARAQAGKPCVWGATGPDSYDGASLVRAAWLAAGVLLPRSAHDQALAGAPVSLSSARPGDLVFFQDTPDHVGLCTGDGTVVHAPGPGAFIREEPLHQAGPVDGVVRPG